jgi:hypothetical protein
MRCLPRQTAGAAPAPADPLRDVHMRLTYRTVRVLISVAALGERRSYPSNREIGVASRMQDQGQVSKLLTCLRGLGLIENVADPRLKEGPDAWRLTARGRELEGAISEQTSRS